MNTIVARIAVGFLVLFDFCTAAFATTCCGDCDGNGQVTLGEVSNTVSSYLGQCVPLTLPCGNGVLDPGEECELGTLYGSTCATLGGIDGTLACTPGTCTYNVSGCRTGRAFVTSTTYSGDLGGLAGGDAKCQARADAAGLGGTWRAWLSTASVDARNHITPAAYRLIDNTTVVSANGVDLLDGAIAANINVDEFGTNSFPNVWTGTNNDGSKRSNHCSSWTTTADSGDYGQNDFLTTLWSYRNAISHCLANLRLYCFEEVPLTRVFVTSTFYNGSLGGLAGADSKCQAAADAANLGGQWIAWLSTSTTNARDRIPAGRPIQRLDGARVAADRDDLIDGNLLVPITVTETFSVLSHPLDRSWTGTAADGTAHGLLCADWTSDERTVYGQYGINTQNDSRWTTNNNQACSDGNHLYCFQP